MPLKSLMKRKWTTSEAPVSSEACIPPAQAARAGVAPGPDRHATPGDGYGRRARRVPRTRGLVTPYAGLSLRQDANRT